MMKIWKLIYSVKFVQSFQMIPSIALIVIAKHAPDVQRVQMPQLSILKRAKKSYKKGN